MKFLSIDIETTGLDPSVCSILQIAGVLDDTASWGVVPVNELPSFNWYFNPGVVSGDLAAFAINKELIQRITTGEGVFKDYSRVAMNLGLFLQDHGVVGKVTLAGKNVAGFDLGFLRRLPGWGELGIHHRVIDPGMLWWNPKTDDPLPSTALCCARAGLEYDGRHDALGDARQVVELIRRHYGQH